MIRFGIIGTNFITERFISALYENEDIALTAVYSRTEERGKEFAAEHNISHIFTDLEDMVQSDVVDAVYIASPNSLHAGQAVICMNHGKHVLCEKPIASNTHELKQMIEAATNNNVVLMEALKSTLLPNFQTIQEHLFKIGKVRRYFASYCQYSSRYDAYKAGTVLNAFNPIYSNGALMDLGIYCLYPMVVLFDQPEHVKANGIMLTSGVDGQGTIIAKYPEMDAVVTYSKINATILPSEIQGEEGSIVIDKISDPEKVEIHYRDGRIEDITLPQNEQTMYYEIKEFIDVIRNGKKQSSVNSHSKSLTVMGIMDEARKQMGLEYPADRITENN